MDRVTEYAKSVVDGKVICGKLHYLACKRHLQDLEKQNTENFPYFWDNAASERVLNFAETLIIAEGTEPKPVKLIPSQAFDIGCTFGWFKVNNRKRRFRRRYKSVARQNGKSFENGIMGTYIAGFNGYQYGKLFTVATKKRQSRIAWEEMSKFISVDPDLSEYFTVKDYSSLIICKRNHCTIEALSKEGGLQDGFRSIFSSIDELQQHKDNKIYKAIYNGTRSLDETLVSMITTRGDKINSFCKEMDDYCIKILEGTATAEDFFVDIYSLDDNDDVWDSNNWVKANPFICSPGNEIKFEVLKSDAQTAKDMGGADMRDFLVKVLNKWVQNSDDNFIVADKWQECGCEKTLDDFKGSSCWVGLDLSSGGDLTTFALEFPYDEVDGATVRRKYYFHSHSFMPRGRLEEHVETDLAPYDLWENMELITVTGGSNDFKNDYKFIIKELSRLKEEYSLNFLGIGIDPHNADGIISDLESFGCPVIIITQSARFLNDATVDIQLLVKSNLVEYNKNNELLIWSFLNARIVRNSFDEIKVDKRQGDKHKRIDPVDACVDAHSAMLKSKGREEDVNLQSELEKYLQMMNWS